VDGVSKVQPNGMPISHHERITKAVKMPPISCVKRRPLERIVRRQFNAETVKKEI
jgi:hypothetical protein